MRRLFLIIDGYNLLHASSFGRRRYGPGEFERARLSLVRELNRRLEAQVASDAIVVFDGQELSAPPDRTEAAAADGAGPAEVGGVTVRYSPSGVEADSIIETLLNQHSAPKQVVVVSEDHRLQRAATRRGARFAKSREFWSAIEDVCQATVESAETGSPRGSSSNRDDTSSRPETDRKWEQHCLGIDPREIEQQIRREFRRQ